MVKRKTKQMTIKDAVAWVESFEVLDREQEEAKRVTVQALQRQIPRKPVYKVNGFGWAVKRCPSCSGVVYNSEWTDGCNRVMFAEWCLHCGQRFTTLGRHLGEWTEEVDE